MTFLALVGLDMSLEMDVGVSVTSYVAAVATGVACALGCWFKAVDRRLSASERVVVFSRFPKAGTTKTRLIPAVGKEGAAYLQRRMTESLLTELAKWWSRQASTGTLVELRHYGGSKQDMERWLNPLFSDGQLLMRPQPSHGGLGTKITECFRVAFAEGAQRVCIVGCDIPALSCAEVDAAFAALKEEEDSANGKIVLGPAEDGGYYLVALSRGVWAAHQRQQRGSGPGLTFLEALFDGSKIAWGTETVRTQQLHVAAELSVDSMVLPKVLSDVDEVEDMPAAEDALGLGPDVLRAITLAHQGVSAQEVRDTVRAQPPGWHNGALEVILRKHGMGTAEMSGRATPNPERIASALERPEINNVWVLP